jgi:hypothetical protein
VEFLVVLAILLIVVAVVTWPLRREWMAREGGEPELVDREQEHRRSELAELEAARDAKYREIRDAELDYRTGKLSREDYEAVDGALRTEAVEILNRLEASAGE